MVTIEGADAIVAAAGETRRWQSLQQRRAQLQALDDGPQWSAVLVETFRYWNSLADNDFDRLLATVRWLRQNPDSGLLIRQLPIPRCRHQMAGYTPHCGDGASGAARCA